MKRTLSALACLSVLASVGCSGKLTRANAQSQLEWQLQQLQHLHHDPQLTVQTGLVSGYCSLDTMGNYDPVAEGAAYSFLSRLGMATIQSADYPHVSRVTLTQAGKQVVSGEPYAHTQRPHCDSWQVNLPVAMVSGVTITGIQQEGVRAKVDVRLCHKLTPLGVALKNMNPSDDQQIQLGIGSGFFDTYHFVKPDEYCEYESVMFNKYDDGWRGQPL